MTAVHFMPWRLAAAEGLPGFVSAGEIPDMLTRYGFAHVLDTGSWLGSVVRLRERIARALERARPACADDQACPPNTATGSGHPSS